MKQFLFVALLGLLSFSANAHRSGYGRDHGHHARQYAPSQHRQVYYGGHGRDRSYGHGRKHKGHKHGRKHFSNRSNNGYGYNQMPYRNMRSGNGGQGQNRIYNQPGNGQGAR